MTYIFGGLEFLPQLLALGASLEGSHLVHFTRSDQQVQVVLSHPFGRAGGREAAAVPNTAPHRHGPASRLFCLFADQTRAAADHVASFTASSLCENRGETIETKAKRADANFSAWTQAAGSHSNRAAWSDFTKATLLEAQPRGGPSLLSTTVLLI